MVSWIPDSGAGDVWTWVALDPDTKLVPCWFIGQRDAGCAYHFMHDLKSRLTNGFSKKLENHEHAVAIHYMFYNFGRIHQSLRVTPAMEAGISDHVWSIKEMIALLRK